MITNRRLTLLGLGLPEAICLVAYSAIVLFLVPYHEPWTDEAQGWLIASSSSLHAILTRVLHYEVAPPLWQLTLWPLVKLHLGFRSANWLSACLGILSAYVILRHAPFPRLFRCLLPFTFFLQYQYALVARPYTYFPLLLFVLCVLFRRGQARSLLFVITAGLLANINLHCAVYAVVLFVVCFLSIGERAYQSSEKGNLFNRRRGVPLLFTVFCTALIVVIATAFPAPDQDMSGPFQRFRPLTSRFVPMETIPVGMTPDSSPIASQVTTRLSRSPGRLLRYFAAVSFHSLSALLFPFSRSSLLATIFLVFCVAWFWQRKQLVLLIPAACLALSYSVLPTAAYHTGLFLVAIVASLWMGWPEQHASESSGFYLAFAIACAAVMFVQIEWAIRADRYDLRGDYDPSKTTANYLRANFPNARIAAFSYHTETLQLYGPFRLLGWQHPFWTWSDASQPNSFKESILAMRPDIIVTGSGVPEDHTIEGQIDKKLEGLRVGEDVTRWWEARGWRVTHEFCGDQFGYGGKNYQICISVLEPKKN